jgi:hypothetical protein
MTETSPRLTAIGSLERQRAASEQTLREVKAAFDELERKRDRVKAELSRANKHSWWSRLFSLFR